MSSQQWTWLSVAGVANAQQLVALLNTRMKALENWASPFAERSGVYLDDGGAFYNALHPRYGVRGRVDTDCSSQFQDVIDHVADEGGGPVFIPRPPGGTYRMAGLIKRTNVSLIGAGAQAVTIQPPDGSKASVLTIPAGRVEYGHIRGLKLLSNGETPTAGATDECHGIYFDAELSGADGGWWRSELADLDIHDFEGWGIWFRGGTQTGDIFQFCTMRNVSAYNFNSVSPAGAARWSGRCGQWEVIDCRFDGPGKGTGEDYVVRVERERNAADTAYTASAGNFPYVINFRGTSFQAGMTGVLVDRAEGALFDGCYWEELENGILVENSTRAVTVEASNFRNINDGASGGVAIEAGTNARVRSRGNTFLGTVDNHYKASNLGAVEVVADDYATAATASATSSGLAGQITAAATIDLRWYKYVFIPTSATEIATIQAHRSVGDPVMIRAHNGSIVFNTSGNLNLGQRASPFTLNQNEIAAWVWDDALSKYVLLSVNA